MTDSDFDPVLSPAEQRWMPYVLIGLVLLTMVLARLGDCDMPDRATPKPPAETAPRGLALPDTSP